MVAASLKQTKMTILLSLNAAAILVAGVLIAGAIWLNGGMDFRVVGERSDEVSEEIEATEMIDAESNTKSDLTEAQKEYKTSVYTSTGVDSAPVPDGELWGEDSITIHQTADFDICVGGELDDLGEICLTNVTTDDSKIPLFLIVFIAFQDMRES